MVMKQGFWTFDEWGMVMNRWVEFPPSNFLQKVELWIRLHKILVNYFTLKTIYTVAGVVGFVKDIEYDPEKSLLQEYVRVLVVLDLSLSVRDKKSINLPKGGGTTWIDVEYEIIRKKCFHCFRLTHEKQRCPIFRNQKGKAAESGKQRVAIPSGLGPRMHHTNLSATLMPMLAPAVPPGFTPRPNLVAAEVFEQWQLYMNCTDPEERRIR